MHKLFIILLVLTLIAACKQDYKYCKVAYFTEEHDVFLKIKTTLYDNDIYKMSMTNNRNFPKGFTFNILANLSSKKYRQLDSFPVINLNKTGIEDTVYYSNSGNYYQDTVEKYYPLVQLYSPTLPFTLRFIEEQTFNVYKSNYKVLVYKYNDNVSYNIFKKEPVYSSFAYYLENFGFLGFGNSSKLYVRITKVVNSPVPLEYLKILTNKINNEYLNKVDLLSK